MSWGYRTIVKFVQGHEQTIYEGFNPDEALRAVGRVSLNPNVIAAVEIRDREGLLHTVWNRHRDPPDFY